MYAHLLIMDFDLSNLISMARKQSAQGTNDEINCINFEQIFLVSLEKNRNNHKNMFNFVQQFIMYFFYDYIFFTFILQIKICSNILCVPQSAEIFTNLVLAK